MTGLRSPKAGGDAGAPVRREGSRFPPGKDVRFDGRQAGAHLSFLQAVAAGILPAVEGGILAARNERGSGRAT